MQSQDLRYIIPAGQIIHRDGKNSRTKASTHTPLADTFLYDFEKGTQETVPRGHLLVQRIFIGRQQLIREIIVLIDQYINLREAVLANVSQDLLKHLGSIITARELKILEHVTVMRHHNFHRRTVQAIEVTLQPLHIISHNHG